MKLMIAAALLGCSLTGCSTTRYVTIHCVTPEQYEELKAAEPPKVGNILTGNAEEDIRPIAGSAVRLRSWGKSMLFVLEGCTQK